ncbi:PASTA domain-containing protein [Rhodococcus chondri]|uniref:PASTA domain-containing protein n=1 Tax=Rhodococcus chondri TaxID=3065941 RepID=A0ABU7JW12_9NOCA|nr:PASTA domain-containing protein [Rhodococcus sp. CC-R104]MEE2034205.1 PASTA domain-containing protein [Rhodococcus sp. CC-R104]
MRTTLSAAACAAAGALLLSPLAAGVATAQPGPHVVGMSQEQATTTLREANVPYRIINRAGSTMQDCRVTEQRDLGYDVEVSYDWDGKEWDKIETKVWRGIGLTIFCN